MTGKQLQIGAWALGGMMACTALGQSAPLTPAAPVAAPSAAPAAAAVAPPLPEAGSPELLLFQDMPVVVAAGKREQTQRQATASVSVVSADEIELFGYRSLADVLRGQRSFYLFSDGLNQLAGVRGFLRPGEWNARMMVLVDGRPTREVIFGQTHLDRDFVVPMELLNRVEIIRGPGSALYGNNAVFAVINAVTKTGAEINGVQLKLSGGTQETGRASLTLGKAFDNGWDIVASATGFTSEGDRDIRYDSVNDPAYNFGHIRDADHQGVESVFVKAQKGELTLTLDYEERDQGNRAATYLVSWFNPGSMREERANATAKWDHEISGNQSIHAMLSYGHYRYSQYWGIDDDGAGNPYTSTSTATDQWVQGEFHYDWRATDTIHLLAGADGQQSVFTEQRDYDSISGTNLDVKPSFGTAGAFAELEYQPTTWLSLTGGIRVDYVQRVGTLVSPRFAAILTPTPQDAFKLLYGRAFRAPNLYEMFYASEGSNEPNPELRPEIVDTYEAVWERQWQDGWRTTLDGYLWTMADSMENVDLPDGAVQTQNTGASRAYGLEAEIEKKWKSGARIRAYATATRAESHSQTLAHSPAWITGLSAAIPVINKRTFLAVEPQIVGPQKSDLGEYTDPTFVTNVVFTTRDFMTKGLDVQLGVYNLFGEYARMPHSDSSTHVQPTLDYPHTQFIASIMYKF